MLRQLHIRDLAVIRDVVLEIAGGFSALTGETGAGKSILIDALALATGERADTQQIRAGAPRLEVSAVFEPDADSEAARWLRAADLHEDEEPTVLRRVVADDGRSRAWINARPVPVQTLRELGALLVDICGQQDYQSLRHRQAQRAVVDALGGHDGLCSQVRDAWQAWAQTRERLAQVDAGLQERESRESLLRFQVGELDTLDARAGEAGELEREHTLLAHRLRVAAAVDQALTATYDADEGSAQAALGQARQALTDAVRFDPELAAPLKLLAEAEAQLGEAAILLRHRLGDLEPDPGREAEVADRLAALRECARKHRVTPDELPALHQSLAQALADLTDTAGSRENLAEALRSHRATYDKLAAALSAGRRAAAGKLGAAVTDNMGSLGMTGGQFTVQLTPLAAEHCGPDGADEVEFLVTTNPGQPPAALRRVASGGELSRLNLAIQVVATAARGAPTQIFDEVDAGVGGAVAEIVGRRLRDLGGSRQVLCITHLPQVAAQAATQILVAKVVVDGSTETLVRLLTAAERVEETARMLGGVQITAQTRAHAEEMLATARAPVRPGPRRRAR